jgi:hypothetical protein
MVYKDIVILSQVIDTGSFEPLVSFPNFYLIFCCFSVKQNWWIRTSSGKRNKSVSGNIACPCSYFLLFVYRATLMIWTFHHFNICPL